MNNEKKIVVVDDHAMFRKGLCMLINMFANYTILFDAENGKDFIHKLKENDLPDIVLMDISMPEMDGYDTTVWLKNKHPEIKVIALSTMDADTAIIKMIKCGAKGYVLKDAEPDELKLAFNEVLSKGFFYNELVSRKILNSINLLVDEDSSVNKLLKLSERELTFLQLACSEKSYAQIAKEMFVSERTIDGYRDALFKKLNLNTRVGLVLYAIKNGIVVL
ncbi:MAG: DNA-binding response regulator [Chitinophaga sp.]|jgi:DNA-binding NarL/FixJ family response regulator|nr:DNA-binding response regulator [Chitinophaga sp.]